MNIDTKVDLTTLHDQIVADIKAKYPALETVEFYRGEAREDRNTLPTPACLLSLNELEPSEENDPETEQICVYAHFEAELIISFRAQRAKHSIRGLAASFCAWLHKRKWTDPSQPGKKLPTGPCIVVGAYEDDFASMTSGQRDANLPQFEVFRVEWRQLVTLGDTVWTDEGTTPTEVFARMNIGGDPVTDYTEITP